ncbi:hypothetical protein IWW52_005313, partial [Coemansia sp. RSA 2704]
PECHKPTHTVYESVESKCKPECEPECHENKHTVYESVDQKWEEPQEEHHPETCSQVIHMADTLAESDFDEDSDSESA